jgi:hypothetical protein
MKVELVDNKKKDSLVEVNEELIEVFDDLLAQEGWDANRVLKVSAKKIAALREEAAVLLKQATSNTKQVSTDFIMVEDKADFISLYVLLYQAEGTSLDKWHDRVATLVKHHVSLPIYREEKTVQKVLRNKKNRNNYGYVEVLVPEDRIHERLSGQKDTEGHELIALHGDAIKKDHIRWFCDGKKYYVFDAKEGFQLLDNKV